MSVPVIVRPEAENDIRAIRNFLDLARTGFGDNFARKLKEVFERIELMPTIYGFVWQDVRAVRVRKFRYVVYYLLFLDRVETLAVMHGSQHDSAWKSCV